MDDRPRLITIPVSHYCEKGRWALDAAVISYRERRYPPAIHRIVTARCGNPTARVLVDGRRVVRGSDKIPVVRPLIRQAFGVRSDARPRAAERIEEVFAHADAQRGGSAYLVGDRFTAADLTFAALGAPLVAPPSYGVALPPLDQVPEAFRSALERWRSTASGAAILAVYQRHRLEPPRSTPTTPEGVPR